MRRWILLRGLTREAAHWGDFPALLARRLGPGHSVDTLDLPGSGRWHAECSPASVAALAQACQARAEAGAPPVLVAMSLGAMVALEWCRTEPQALAGCVLINTSAGGHSPFWDRLQPANYPHLLRWLLLPGDPLARERAVLRMTSADAARHPGVQEAWAAIARARPVRRRSALHQLLAAARWRAPAHAPGCPLLLLASAGDRLVSPRCSQRLADGWGVPLHLHPWAGHDLPLDDPEWVVDAIGRWATGLG